MIKPIVAMAVKDVKSAYNDARDVVLHLLVPVAVGSILGFSMSGMTSKDLPVVPLAVVKEGDWESESLIDRLKANAGLQVELSGREEALRKLGDGKASAVLVLERSRARLYVDPARRAMTPILIGVVRSAASGAGATPPIDVEPVQSAASNPFAVVFPGIAVMFMLFSSMGGALGLLKEKWRGILRRILAAPVTPFQIVAGKSLGIVLTTLVQFYVYLAFFMLAWGVRPNGSWAGLIVMSLAISASCASLAMFLSCLGRSEAGVHAASLLVVLGMSALGGSMFPYAYMPPAMQDAASLSINKWGIVGLESVLWRGLGFEAVLLPVLALAGFTFAFLFVGSRLFRFQS